MTASFGTGSPTIAALLPAAAASYGEQSATSFKQGDTWVQQSYAELLTDTTAVALGLLAQGVQAGDRVAILGNTSRAWTVVDLAATRIGAIVVPIYQTNSPEECDWVLRDSGAGRGLRGERRAGRQDRQDPRCAACAGACGHLGGRGRRRHAPRRADRHGRWRRCRSDHRAHRGGAPEDPFTIIYTSGTTGPPKGCVLTHGNYAAIVKSALSSGLIQDAAEDGDVLYLFLPLAHSFARLMQLAVLDAGAMLAYFGGDTQAVIGEIQEVRPTVLPSVPRIFEKLFTVAVQMAGEETVQQATKVGLQMRELTAPVSRSRRSCRPQPISSRRASLAWCAASSAVACAARSPAPRPSAST